MRERNVRIPSRLRYSYSRDLGILTPQSLKAHSQGWLTTGAPAMTHGIIVQLPVSVAFGTDEEFDLRVQLESDLTRVLSNARAGECVGGGIDTSHLNLHFDGITDPPITLSLLKQVLASAGHLNRATIILETPSSTDPDERDQQVLWSPHRASKIPVV